MCMLRNWTASLAAIAALAGGLTIGTALAQSPADPWAMELPSNSATSAALAGSGADPLACAESEAGMAESPNGVAAGIMCIIGGSTTARPAAVAAQGSDPEDPPQTPTAAEIVEAILSGQ
jgi:hypothetical protein